MRERTLQERLSTLKQNQRMVNVVTDLHTFEEMRIVENLQDSLKVLDKRTNVTFILHYSEIKSFEH